MSRILAIAALSLVMAGCANLQAVHNTCIPLKAYSPAERAALAAAVEALEPTNPMVDAMIDYGRMRKADVACVAAHL